MCIPFQYQDRPGGYYYHLSVNLTLAENIQRAVKYYRTKYGIAPKVVYVAPCDLLPGQTAESLGPGVEINAAMPVGLLWVGFPHPEAEDYTQ